MSDVIYLKGVKISQAQIMTNGRFTPEYLARVAERYPQPKPTTVWETLPQEIRDRIETPYSYESFYIVPRAGRPERSKEFCFISARTHDLGGVDWTDIYKIETDKARALIREGKLTAWLNWLNPLPPEER